MGQRLAAFTPARNLVIHGLHTFVGPWVYGYTLSRTRFLDSVLETCLNGGDGDGDSASKQNKSSTFAKNKTKIEQLAVLGAGFDSRAYRFPLQANNVRAFEVDLPTTSRDKQRALARMGIDFAKHPVTFVQIDFATQSLDMQLAAAGFDKAKPALFVWEGVTMYIPEAAVRSVLQFLASCAPGSVAAFDFVSAEFGQVREKEDDLFPKCFKNEYEEDVERIEEREEEEEVEKEEGKVEAITTNKKGSSGLFKACGVFCLFREQSIVPFFVTFFFFFTSAVVDRA